MRRLLLTFCSCLMALPALGGPAVDGARARRAQAAMRVAELAGKQTAEQSELSALAVSIESQKKQKKGRLLPGGELDRQLKRSQELSESLTATAHELAQAEAEQEKATRELEQQLGIEAEAVRERAEKTQDREARKRSIAELRALRSEREAVRAQLPSSSAVQLADRDSDDPADLLEQADALRDQEDKVRRELATLETRIGERRAEREFDRRMSDFLGEEAIFDDQDRRLRLRRESTEAPAAAFGSNRSVNTTKGGGEPPLGGMFNGPPAGSDLAAGGGPQPQFEGSAPQSPGFSPGAVDLNQSEKSHLARASDARPAVGAARAAPGEDELASLEQQRKKLKGLADDLRSRAGRLEQKAKTLR